MHQYDQFKQDMEKLHKADLQNPIMANRNEPGKPNSDGNVSNLFRFDRQQTIPNCTVITFDGLDGFMWIGPDGVRHNEGLRWPTMRIEQNCTVEVLTDEYGRESKGWYKDGTERTD
jgi:hypothetical protein